MLCVLSCILPPPPPNRTLPHVYTCVFKMLIPVLSFCLPPRPPVCRDSLCRSGASRFSRERGGVSRARVFRAAAKPEGWWNICILVLMPPHIPWNFSSYPLPFFAVFSRACASVDSTALLSLCVCVGLPFTALSSRRFSGSVVLIAQRCP